MGRQIRWIVPLMIRFMLLPLNILRYTTSEFIDPVLGQFAESIDLSNTWALNHGG